MRAAMLAFGLCVVLGSLPSGAAQSYHWESDLEYWGQQVGQEFLDPALGLQVSVAEDGLIVGTTCSAAARLAAIQCIRLVHPYAVAGCGVIVGIATYHGCAAAENEVAERLSQGPAFVMEPVVHPGPFTVSCVSFDCAYDPTPRVAPLGSPWAYDAWVTGYYDPYYDPYYGYGW